MVIFPGVAHPSTFQYFQGNVGQILTSLKEYDPGTRKKYGANPDTETVANALLQLEMNFEQEGFGMHPSFLTWDYWEIVKKWLDAHQAESSDDDSCKFSREITLATELEKAWYAAEEALEVITKIRGQITIRQEAFERAEHVHLLVTTPA